MPTQAWHIARHSAPAEWRDAVVAAFDSGSRRWGYVYCFPIIERIGTLISGLSASSIVMVSVLPSTGGA